MAFFSFISLYYQVKEERLSVYREVRGEECKGLKGDDRASMLEA